MSKYSLLQHHCWSLQANDESYFQEKGEAILDVDKSLFWPSVKNSEENS